MIKQPRFLSMKIEEDNFRSSVWVVLFCGESLVLKISYMV